MTYFVCLTKMKSLILLTIFLILKLTRSVLIDSNILLFRDKKEDRNPPYKLSYTVALLRKTNLLTNGALISQSWVLTDAKELYM